MPLPESQLYLRDKVSENHRVLPAHKLSEAYLCLLRLASVCYCIPYEQQLTTRLMAGGSLLGSFAPSDVFLPLYPPVGKLMPQDALDGPTLTGVSTRKKSSWLPKDESRGEGYPASPAPTCGLTEGTAELRACCCL